MFGESWDTKVRSQAELIETSEFSGQIGEEGEKIQCLLLLWLLFKSFFIKKKCYF